MSINLDNDIARRLNEGMRDGDTVELPFPVAYIWALNGQASFKSQGGALYYGGWACKVEDINALVEQQGLMKPIDWKQATISTRDGNEFEAYTTRNVVVAPLGKRVSWILDGRRFPEYVEGGRRHLQVLCYMAITQGENGSKQIVPWGPVVLTAKGYQARNMLDAFNKWDKATSQIRWKIAPGIPAWCFYLSLGTFGKERQAINVGKPGAQSPITPIAAYIPDKITEDLITSLFVNNQVAGQMVELQDQASDWLKAWKEPVIDTKAGAVEPEDDFFTGAPPEEDEIPF